MGGKERKSEKDYINWEKVRDRLTTNYDDVYIYYIYILNIRDACSVPYVSFFLRHVTTVSAIAFTVYTSIYYYYSWVVLCCWATKEMKNIKVYSLFLLLLSSDQVSDKTFFFFRKRAYYSFLSVLWYSRPRCTIFILPTSVSFPLRKRMKRARQSVTASTNSPPVVRKLVDY